MEQQISNLNWFDIMVISIVAISTLFALLRGFIKAAFSLITWVCSGVAAAVLYPYLHPYISESVHSEKLAMAVSFLSGFLIVFIILAIINSQIIHALRKITGGVIDRLLGLGFGAARGVLIVCLIFFSISFTSKNLHLGANPERPGPQFFAKAATYEVLEMATNRVVAFLPEDMPKRFEETVGRVKDMTVTAMGEEMESSPSSAKTFSDKQRQVMKQVISAIPKEDLAEVYKKNDGDTSKLSEFEKVEIFKEILEKYKGYVKEGKIAVDKVVSDQALQDLDDTLNAEKTAPQQPAPEATESEGELGYKDNSIKQLDRLIDGVK